MRLTYGSLLFVVALASCGTEIIGGPSDSSASSSSSASSASSTSSGMGGNGGSAGTGGFGGTVTASPPPQCVVDSDCTLIDDCCRCEGISNKESVPECPLPECFAPTCGTIGLPNPKAVCRAGQCVVDADCNQGHALCDSIPPTCPPGQTVHVTNGCWGGCIDVTECREVGSCTQCGAGQACVTSNTMMVPAPHCVDVPSSCNGQITCDCMGESVCGFATTCTQVSPTELECLDLTTAP
jgi:hypothetical protein